MSDSSTALSPVLQFRQDLQTKLRDGVRRAIVVLRRIRRALRRRGA